MISCSYSVMLRVCVLSGSAAVTCARPCSVCCLTPSLFDRKGLFRVENLRYEPPGLSQLIISSYFELAHASLQCFDLISCTLVSRSNGQLCEVGKVPQTLVDLLPSLHRVRRLLLRAVSHCRHPTTGDVPI